MHTHHCYCLHRIGEFVLHEVSGSRWSLRASAWCCPLKNRGLRQSSAHCPRRRSEPTVPSCVTLLVESLRWAEETSPRTMASTAGRSSYLMCVPRPTKTSLRCQQDQSLGLGLRQGQTPEGNLVPTKRRLRRQRVDHRDLDVLEEGWGLA